MNINTSLNHSNQESAFQSRPVQNINLNTRQQQDSRDTASLSDHARQLQQSEQQKKSLVDSLESSQLNIEEPSSDENIRVSSSIGQQVSASSLTRAEALDIYRSIQNLL